MAKERKKEDLDFEIGFYERLIEEDPNFVDALIPLGDDYTKRGLYEKGLGVDVRLVKLRPHDPVVWYNLACSYSLLGRLDEALEALEKAIRLGYDDFNHVLRDPDMANLRKTDRFRRLLAQYAGEAGQDEERPRGSEDSREGEG